MVLDSGNLLFKRSGKFSSGSAEYISAAALAEAYALLGFDAVGIGIQDLAGGIDLLLSSEKSGVPWTSANLFHPEGPLLFKPYREKHLAGLAVAIVGVTGPSPSKTDTFQIKEPAPELAVLLPELDKSFDLIVVLSTWAMKKSAELAEQFPEIDIIIAADSAKGNTAPFQAGNAIITQTGTRGQYLGVLSVLWHDKPWEKSGDEQLALYQSRLRSLNRQLSRLQSSPVTNAGKTESIKLLESDRQQLEKQIADLQKEIEAGTRTDDYSRYTCTFLPLKRTGRSHPQMTDIVSTAKERINGLYNK